MATINIGSFDSGAAGWYDVYFSYSSITWYNGVYTINSPSIILSKEGYYTTNKIVMYESPFGRDWDGGYSNYITLSNASSFTVSSSAATITLTDAVNLYYTGEGCPTEYIYEPWAHGYGYWSDTYYTITLTPGCDRTAPTVTQYDITNTTKDSMTIKAKANVLCNNWQYSINNGQTWTTFHSGDVAANTDVSYTITGLSTNTSYTVYIRATKKSNGLTGTSGGKTAKTLGASTMSDVTADIGSTYRFSITRFDSSFTHVITYVFGSASGTAVSSTSSTTPTWTIPTSLANQIPTENSGTGTITLSTYSGSTLIGSYTYTLTLNIPSSWSPSFSLQITPVNSNTWLASQNIYVKGYSKVKVDYVNPTPSTGSTISGYTTTGLDTTGTTNPWTSNILTSAGSNTITGVVTDKRGKTTSHYATFSVYDYNAPVTSKLQFEKGTYSGGTWVVDPNGRDVKVTYITAHSALNGNNSITATIKLNGSTISSSTITTDTERAEYLTNLDTLRVYTLQIQLTDKVGNTGTRELEIPTMPIPLSFDFAKHSTGVGGVPQGTQSFDVFYSSQFRNNVDISGYLFTVPSTLVGGIDLNQVISYGHYNATSTSQVQQFINCPTTQPFNMYIFDGRGQKNGSYRIQFIVTYNLTAYARYTTNATSTTPTFSEWKTIIS